MVRPMIGKGILEYDDGSSYEVDARVEFRNSRGAMSGEGTIYCPEMLTLAMRKEGATLSVSGQKFRIMITRATADGEGYVKTSGGPISE